MPPNITPPKPSGRKGPRFPQGLGLPCHEAEVASRDFYTTEIVDEQLLVTRIRTVVKVYSNVCCHRGNMVAEGRGNAGRFTCKYHGWTLHGTASCLVLR